MHLHTNGPYAKSSTLTLFIVSLICVGARYYIRLRLQRRLWIDDGFLLFGVCCLICAMGILFVFINQLYLIEAMLLGVMVDIPSDFQKQALNFQKWVVICLILVWMSVYAVK